VLAENQPMKELLVTRIFEEEVFQRQGGPNLTYSAAVLQKHPISSSSITWRDDEIWIV
jgi:hypothetical protein